MVDGTAVYILNFACNSMTKVGNNEDTDQYILLLIMIIILKHIKNLMKKRFKL